MRHSQGLCELLAGQYRTESGIRQTKVPENSVIPGFRGSRRGRPDREKEAEYRVQVLPVVLSLSPGGTERLVIEICQRLPDGMVPAVCCLDEPGDWAGELTARGIPVVALGRRAGFHPSLATQIAAIARRVGASVIHCHHYSPYVYGALATLLNRNCGLVFTEHGRLSDAVPSRKRRLVNPWLARIPGAIVAVSADLKRHMVAEGFPERRVEVIYNGIAVGARAAEDDRAAVRTSLGLPLDAFVVGSVARLDPVKNLGSLLQAHASVLAAIPDARLVVVGTGPEQASLEADARAIGIGEHVIFAGYRADARRVMSAFDLYVNCSTYEGVSLTILEAMAAGLPVVATTVGGNPEVVVDGETGLLVLARGAPPLAAAIAALGSDSQRGRRMGEAGRRRVESAFSIERMVDEYRREYARHSKR
jgi:glycosyltransferase involved in cell wall biosynthesis